MYRRLDPFGNPNVGVYALVTKDRLVLPPGLTEKEATEMELVFGQKSVQTTIGGSTLVGSLAVANSTGVVVADFATDGEIKILEDAGWKVARLRHAKLNAAGNNILANDMGAVVHPGFRDKDVRIISETLGVEAVRSTLGGVATLGTAACATNRGAIVHPLATEDELAFIKSSLHVPAMVGTVNHGHGLVGAGMAANERGVVCGGRTTGIELGRIDEALNFLEET